MNEEEKEIFAEILKDPKIFNKRGSVSPGIFAKYRRGCVQNSHH